MTNEDLIKLVDELRTLPKENEWLEFKKGTATSNKKLGQYISGLSNAACICNESFAYLIFGIDNISQDVIGTNYKFKNRKEGNEELELWIRRGLNPSIKFDHFICEYPSKNTSLHVEVFRIPPATGEPTYFKTQSFIRIGTNLTDLKNSLIIFELSTILKLIGLLN